MKRSRSISLVLASTVPFLLTACGKDTVTKTVSETKTFSGVKECTDAKIPANVCQQSMIMALNEHKKIAPIYETKEACEADFTAGMCAETLLRYSPKMAGFQVTLSGEVEMTREQAQRADQASGGGGGGGTTIINNGSGGGGDFLMGMLIGNMMSTPRYYSEPIYTERNNRGDFKRSTISQRVKSGESFKSSVQSKSGFDYKKSGGMTSALSNRASTAKKAPAPRSSTSSFTRTPAKSSSISRGGFGSQASARSSFGSSFGG